MGRCAVTLVASVLVATAIAGCDSDRPSSGDPEPTTTSRTAPTAFAAELTGAAVVPGPGDADGRGTVEITIPPYGGQICIELTVERVEGLASVQLALGDEGQPGPIVAQLPAPGTRSPDNCVAFIPPEAMSGFERDPTGYFVLVRSRALPDGALRGQIVEAPAPHRLGG